MRDLGPFPRYCHIFVNILYYLPLLHITLNNTFGVASVIPNGILVAPLREFMKYIRCSMILEGCNETLHNGVTGIISTWLLAIHALAKLTIAIATKRVEQKEILVL